MPNSIGPSMGFMDKLSQRLRGQRSSMNMPGKDVELPDERPKKKKKFGFVESGSKADQMISGFNKLRELSKPR